MSFYAMYSNCVDDIIGGTTDPTSEIPDDSGDTDVEFIPISKFEFDNCDDDNPPLRDMINKIVIARHKLTAKSTTYGQAIDWGRNDNRIVVSVTKAASYEEALKECLISAILQGWKPRSRYNFRNKDFRLSKTQLAIAITFGLMTKKGKINNEFDFEGEYQL